MLVKVLHVLTSLTTVLTWVEVLRMFIKCLTNASSKGKTRVRVDVNLTNSTLSSLTELILWDTYSVWQLTTVFVDDVNILLRNRRRTVENDWEAWELLLNSCENVESQWRRNQTASLWVTCTLLWSELVSTMRSTD